MSDSLETMLSRQASGGSDGFTRDPLETMLTQQASAPPASVPAAVAAGQSINSIPRQIGLTARYGLEGLANTAQVVTEPLRNLVTDPLSRLFGGTGGRPLGEEATRLADSIGLPKPEGANERVIGDATRLMAGAGGLGAAAGAARALPGAMGQAGAFLSSNMPQQLTSAAGAGLAGGASREAGASPLYQGGAALVGGVAGGVLPGAISGTVSAAKNLLTPKATPQQLDAQISVLLGGTGMDYSQLSDAARNSLRSDLADALRAGRELNPDAVRRLADFRTTGLTPTRGSVTLDPVQVTREMNLAKTGANSADGQLQGLARIQNQNNTRLIQNLNNAGAAGGDPFTAGQSAIGAINAADEGMGRTVSGLYSQARDTAGRSAALDGAAFTTNANQALDQALLGGALPPSVAGHMNRIASGEVPFTVDYAEQLKTAIGNLQRASNDGQTRMALGVVRRALDDTPLMPAPTVNPGNLPAVPGTVPPSPATLGQQSIDAFNQARQAARQRFAWQDSGRPIEAALGGAQPDNFVKQFVINGTVEDASSLAQNIPAATRNEVRSAILDHVKKQALSGAEDEVGKVSQSAFNKALNGIGDRKLSLFFSPEELGSLRANARVASYLQVQPAGSAVNNSNTAAMLIGNGYDAFKALANKIPGGQALINQPLTNIEVALHNRQAQNILPGLLAQQQRQPNARYLLPLAAYGGGLLAPQVVNQP